MGFYRGSYICHARDKTGAIWQTTYQVEQEEHQHPRKAASRGVKISDLTVGEMLFSLN
jgi:hypothetical protein